MAGSKTWLREIPKASEILKEVISKLNKEIDFERKVKLGEISPSRAAALLESECYKKYKEYEKIVKEKYIKLGVDPTELEKSLMQSRAPRAGETVERIIQLLLNWMNIPCERRVWFPKRNGELLDIVIPNKKMLLENPQKAIIISLKREVRERWREVVGEAYILRCVHGVPDNIWFATITCDVSKYIIKTISKLGIRVYVPDRCYEDYRKFGARSISQMFDDIMTFLKEKQIK